MTNQYYEPGQRRGERVSALFSAVAGRYDLMNDLQSFGLHRLWKRRLVRLTGAEGGRLALDVCCGTGDIALAMAARGARVAGLDFNEPMLHQALMRAEGTGNAPGFFRGDAQRMPFEDNSFDVVTVGYGLRNLGSWQSGLAEMSRVARPGGKLVVLEFGKPAGRLLRALYFGYLRAIVPMLGLVFCRNAAAYAYILESLRHYPGQEGVAVEMRRLGLRNVRVLNLLWGIMGINYGEKPELAESK